MSFRPADTATGTEILAKYFRALGDPLRVRVLRLLRDEGELSVGVIAARLAVAQSRLSNHLACLRWCGLVATRREHRAIHYRIADERVEQLLELADALLADNAEHVASCARVAP